jgi:hypothetical protein
MISCLDLVLHGDYQRWTKMSFLHVSSISLAYFNTSMPPLESGEAGPSIPNLNSNARYVWQGYCFQSLKESENSQRIAIFCSLDLQEGLLDSPQATSQDLGCLYTCQEINLERGCRMQTENGCIGERHCEGRDCAHYYASIPPFLGISMILLVAVETFVNTLAWLEDFCLDPFAHHFAADVHVVVGRSTHIWEYYQVWSWGHGRVPSQHPLFGQSECRLFGMARLGSWESLPEK